MATYKQVQDFHNAFGVKMPSSPTPMKAEQLLNRMDFITEEVLEAIHATSDNKQHFHELYYELLKRMSRSFNKLYGKDIPEDTLLAQVDAFTDIRYFNTGDFTLIAVEPTNPSDIVNEANMGKLHDGKPVYNEYGKIVKPDNWERDFAPEPRLKAEIQRQIAASV